MKNSWAFCFDANFQWQWQLLNPHFGVWLVSKQGFDELEDCINDAVKCGYAEGSALFLDSRGHVMQSVQ
jgi:hypothetical protein